MALPQGLALRGGPIRQGRATDSVAVCWKTPGKPRGCLEPGGRGGGALHKCATPPPKRNSRRRLGQMQEDRRSLWTEAAAAAAPWFRAPLGILAAGRHIMTVRHQLDAAQWKRGGTVPESFADWWRGRVPGGGGRVDTFENKTQ